MKPLSKYFSFVLILLFVSCSCNINMSSSDDDVVDTSPHYVDIVHDSGLSFYYPNYSYVDFTCDISDPNKDTTIIFACAATFTGTDHNNGPHLLVAQNHVCSGVKFRGYKCPRCNGAFVWYNNNYQFVLDNYAESMDSAAIYGGAAFAQEMMIHEGKQLKTKRPRTNVNRFRALCRQGDKLCVVQSEIAMPFGDFINLLDSANVSEALYLDMGGWDYGVYRTSGDSLEYLTESRDFSMFSNMLLFYK